MDAATPNQLAFYLPPLRTKNTGIANSVYPVLGHLSTPQGLIADFAAQFSLVVRGTAGLLSLYSFCRLTENLPTLRLSTSPQDYYRPCEICLQ